MFIYLILLSSYFSHAEGELLKAEPAVLLQGPAGKFDFMEADPLQGRILAAHTQTSTLELLDTKTGKPLKAIGVGEAQGIAIDPSRHRYFTGNDGNKSVVVVDSQTLKPTAEVKVEGSVDAISYDAKSDVVFAAEDNGSHIWIIDPTKQKILATVKIPGVPEVLQYDSEAKRLLVNIKNTNQVVSVDPSQKKVTATWSTLPATSPHGLIIDGAHQIGFVAGGNANLVAIDLHTGKVIANAKIAPGTDQIAYDTEKQLIYAAGKNQISITRFANSKLIALGEVKSPTGAHTLAVDPLSHAVWITYTDSKHSYFQKYLPTPQLTSDEPRSTGKERDQK